MSNENDQKPNAEKLSLKFYMTDKDLKNNTVTVEIMPKEYADKFAAYQADLLQSIRKDLE